MKPRLPREIELLFPPEIVHEMYKFLTKEDSPKPPSYSSSPQFAKEMKKLQCKALRGKSATYLRELEDFLLDYDDDLGRTKN